MKQSLILFFFALLPLAASAAAVEIGGIYYNLLNGNVAEVTSNPNKYSGDVAIPETVNYNDVIYNVTSIGDEAFGWCSTLTSVTIPNSVTSIGNEAFVWCTNLTRVIIGNSVTSIGESAFSICWSLTSVNIPNSVTYIGNCAFCICSSLRDIYITDIESWCNIKFEDNPLYYAHHLILNNNVLTDLVIPNSVTSIGESAFAFYRDLTSVTIPNSVTSIGNEAFAECYGLTSVTIPNSVTNIGKGAFRSCRGLTSVIIPNSVTCIGEWAFYSGMYNISVDKDNKYYDSRDDCNAIIETSTNTLIQGCLNTFIPSSVTSIGDYAFYGCSDLTGVTIPNSVISIGDEAFSWCSNLTSVDIPNSVTSIGGYAFQNCKGLTSVTIPNSVTSIGDKAFLGCSGLTNVIIPNSVTSIGDYSFGGCSNLLDVYCLAKDIPNTNADAFKDSYIDHMTLHVPENTIETYKSTAPWSGFKDFVVLPNYTMRYMVDGEEYKTVEIEYGAEIIPEDGPEKEGYTFMGWSEIPETMPANDVTVTGIYEKNLLGKCATPTIAFKDGKFKFESMEEGVEFVWSITIADSKEGRGNEVDINGIYKVSVYATKADYEDSDAATIEVDIRGKQGDVSGDGEVDASDITKLIDILLKRNTTTNTEQ